MFFSKFDRKMFQFARKEAYQSDFDGFHTGCVIVYKHHIIGAAANSDKTHPMQARYNQYRDFNKTKSCIKHSLHAEIAAISTIPYTIGKEIDWSKVKVYIYRISPGKEFGFGLAKPCPACQEALKDLGIQHIYYTGDRSYIYEELF